MRNDWATKAVLIFLAANAVRAGTNDFQWQLITLPARASAARFADLDGDGRSDLLAVDTSRLLIYRQRTAGFTNVPDQLIALPPQSAWIAPCDVNAHSGVELLVSTAAGLVYYHQTNGVFESEPRMLIKANQVFRNDDSPSLISLATNAAIPVISETEAVLIQRNDAFEWSRGEPITLNLRRTTWSQERDEWTLGPTSSRSLHIQQSVRSKPAMEKDSEPGNDRISQLIEEMKKAGPRQRFGTNRLDVNQDGREDFILWQLSFGTGLRTRLFVFLRGADGQLPKQETQVLRYPGGPIPVGATQSPPSPIADLNGDGVYELVMLEWKTTITSVSSVVDMTLSGGLEGALVIKSFNQGAFSGSSNAIPIRTVMPIATIVPVEELDQWPFFICGDFNGDGRPDLTVRRSTTQWNILFSRDDGRWFTPQPALTFETPMQGNFEINDLNGDGRSDLVLRAQDDPRIFISLTPSQQTKGRRP